MIIEELSFLTVRSRLAALLLEMARSEKISLPVEAGQRPELASSPSGGDSARKTAAPLRVTLKLTQQEIAARIGTVRELVSRNLGRLQAEGIIRLDGHMLVIQDLERLEHEAVAEE